jgi:hypothetical protein
MSDQSSEMAYFSGVPQADETGKVAKILLLSLKLIFIL